MIVWMIHPKHGRMPCYNNQEVEYNKKHGWIVEGVQKVNDETNLQTSSVPAVETSHVTETSQEDKETAEARIAYFNKFGKKPHHKMKLETILRALRA